MTIEEKINKILENRNRNMSSELRCSKDREKLFSRLRKRRGNGMPIIKDAYKYGDFLLIEDWKWYNKPNYVKVKDSSWDYELIDKKMFLLIDTIIMTGDLVECLTSNYEYIRKCKKWYMEKKK